MAGVVHHAAVVAHMVGIPPELQTDESDHFNVS